MGPDSGLGTVHVPPPVDTSPQQVSPFDQRSSGTPSRPGTTWPNRSGSCSPRLRWRRPSAFPTQPCATGDTSASAPEASAGLPPGSLPRGRRPGPGRRAVRFAPLTRGGGQHGSAAGGQKASPLPGPTGREHSKHFARKVDAQCGLDETSATLLTGLYVDPRAGRAPSTVGVAHRILSGIFTSAVVDRRITSNPCTGTKLRHGCRRARNPVP